MPELLPESVVLEGPFRFVAQPSPVPGDVRSIHRIALLLITLRKCHGDTATFEQLHVLNWAIHSPSSQAEFLSAFQQKGRPDDIIVRFDPGLNRTIDLARGLTLVAWGSGKRLGLTPEGLKRANEISRTTGILDREKGFLDSINGKISHSMIERLVSRWD